MDLLEAEKPFFDDYTRIFIQRIPRYSVKNKTGWVSKNKPLSDTPIISHLRGKYDVGVVGKYYPEYAILDFDDFGLDAIGSVRENLGLDEKNSQLFTSESTNSYHLLLRPYYHNKPPTVNLLHTILEGHCKKYRVEVFPHSKKTIRLPFGPRQRRIDSNGFYLEEWWKKLQWFLKLDEFELSDLNHQTIAPLEYPKQPEIQSKLLEGQQLFENGLQGPNTRHDAQYMVVYYLWRINTPPNTAKRLAWEWIYYKHNGFSREMNRGNHRLVKSEIERQLAFVYEKYEFGNIFPDSTHNVYGGFITKPDIEEIVRVAQASRTRMKFLFELVKYSYPRNQRSFIGIHTNKLTHWASSGTYQKYLAELEERKIVKRSDSYLVNKFSKAIKLNWDFKDSNQAILYDGRAIETFDTTVKLVFNNPRDFKKLLVSAGSERTTAVEAVKSIYGVKKR
jgi:hypothetical protein